MDEGKFPPGGGERVGSGGGGREKGRRIRIASINKKRNVNSGMFKVMAILEFVGQFLLPPWTALRV